MVPSKPPSLNWPCHFFELNVVRISGLGQDVSSPPPLRTLILVLFTEKTNIFIQYSFIHYPVIVYLRKNFLK